MVRSIPRNLKTGDKIKILKSHLLVAADTDNHLLVSKSDFSVLVPTQLPDAVGSQSTIVFLVNFQDKSTQPFTLDQARVRKVPLLRVT